MLAPTMSCGETDYVEPSTFQTWLSSCKPGETLVYVRGDLAYECSSTMPTGPLATLRQLAWIAHKCGQVTLTQKKIATCFYEYRATKLKPRPPERRPVMNMANWRKALSTRLPVT